MKTSLLFLAVCLLACAWLTDASLFNVPTVKERIYRRTQWYCEYKGLKILPGSRIEDLDTCERCTCGRDFLSCAGMVMLIDYSPDDTECVPMIVRCKSVWVTKKFPWRACPEDKMPKMMSAVLGPRPSREPTPDPRT